MALLTVTTDAGDIVLSLDLDRTALVHDFNGKPTGYLDRDVAKGIATALTEAFASDYA